MKTNTYEKLDILGIDISTAEKLEEILAGYMIFHHDEMILDILKLNN